MFEIINDAFCDSYNDALYDNYIILKENIR